VEVWGPPGQETGLADSHLQAYTCSIVRCGLSFLQRGGLDVVDLIVVSHACDSLQGLGSVLLDFVKPKMPVLPFYIPRQAGHSGVSFLEEEFRNLAVRLAEICGREVTNSVLMEAIYEDEAADGLLVRLFDQRRNLSLNDREFYSVVRSREYLPPAEFGKVAESALGKQGQPSGIPIMLSGIVPEPMEILDCISKAGGMVAADDMACTGRRLYPVGWSPKPYHRMAERILNAPPDSTRSSPVDERVRHIRGLCDRYGVKGIVFYNVKFCEPEMFYLPQLRKELSDSGIRSVEVEGDLGERLPRQVVTRIEAFLETLL
jgi:benzoyl-CoA reductase/2-hydroxyglutaryl-CoA dehydratase subunit BcrC/BadD/HgdB